MLLYDMGQFMGQQQFAFCAFGVVFPFIEIDVMSVGKGLGIQFAAELGGRVVMMDAYMTEVNAEGMVHLGEGILREWASFTGLPFDFRGYRGGGC